MVIMMTAVTDKKTIFDSVEAGAVDYIAKPFTGAVLLDKIKKAMSPPIPHVQAVPAGQNTEEASNSPTPRVRRGSGLAASRAAMNPSTDGNPESA